MDKSNRVTNDLYRLFIGGVFVLCGWSEILVGFGMGVAALALVDIVVGSYEWFNVGRDHRCKMK